MRLYKLILFLNILFCTIAASEYSLEKSIENQLIESQIYNYCKGKLSRSETHDLVMKLAKHYFKTSKHNEEPCKTSDLHNQFKAFEINQKYLIEELESSKADLKKCLEEKDTMQAKIETLMKRLEEEQPGSQ